jgi:hypothetical protein
MLLLLETIRNLLDYGLKNQEGRISIEQYNIEIEQAEAEKRTVMADIKNLLKIKSNIGNIYGLYNNP